MSMLADHDCRAKFPGPVGTMLSGMVSFSVLVSPVYSPAFPSLPWVLSMLADHD
ncbi:hypothetical protein CPC08DRAFT_716763 [Agrocybe pediades]|nr:hypothetical protein CPC08DRAFT_716763 [Agrocybe pediades]